MRVLLVDKEADLLPALQGALLSIEGLELYCAPDGPTALQHASLLNGVDVLLTEVFQPGVDGVALRDDLQRIRPLMKTIFLTRHRIDTQHNALQGHPVLPVPVNPDLVLTALLDSRRVPPAIPDSPASPETRNTAPSTPRKDALQSPPKDSPPMGAADFAATPRDILASLPEPSVAPATATLPTSSPQGETDEAPATNLRAPNSPETLSSPRPSLRPGTNLGTYKLLRTESDTIWGPRFGAVHTTLKRAVHLIFLDEEKQNSESHRAAFLGEASAKARAQHPSLLTVYEAAETDGHLFYAIERIEADTLQGLLDRGATLPFPSLQRTAETVAKGLKYFADSQLPHAPLEINDILISHDGTPRLQNLALERPTSLSPESGPSNDIETLGKALHLLSGVDAPASFHFFLERTSQLHFHKIAHWDHFLSQLAALDSDPAALSSNRPDNNDAVDPCAKRSSVSVAAVVLTATLSAAALVWKYTPSESPVPRQIKIPAGQYLVGSGKKIALESFSIDATEITNRHYGRFVAWLRLHPKEAARYDHPEQPPHQNHIPEGWALLFPEKIRAAPLCCSRCHAPSRLRKPMRPSARRRPMNCARSLLRNRAMPMWPRSRPRPTSS
ncbi:MAG: response regulator [Verrucomicrobia bacterium]|nr:response regulator [Verrucomicrobiota bacterium]